MAVNKNILSIVYVFISIIVIIVLIYLLLNCKKHESFCSCRQMTNKICPDPKVLTSLYNSGELTESTDFMKFWNPEPKVIMPDDEFFNR
jgi:uncharacterized membrane protein